MKILFVWPNKDSFGFKPIGISLLSGIAKQLGWETKLFDTTEFDFGFVDNTQAGQSAKIFKPVDRALYGQVKRQVDYVSDFIKTLKDYRPDLLAVSVLSDEVYIASDLSEIAKAIDPSITVIWGGKYPTVNPNGALQYADFACVGEGFGAFRDFLEALDGKGDLHSIPNIYPNGVRPLQEDLDELPYVDWTMFDKRQFYKPFDGNMYRAGDHMLNWGCPRRCSYCINTFYRNLYGQKGCLRRYSVERIIRELASLKERHDLEFMKFHDEDFLLRPVKNLQELSEAYRGEVNIPFTIMTHPHSVTEKKVELIKKMGCVSVSIGIETGNPDLRKNLLKRVDTEDDIVRAFSLLEEQNIRTASFVMLGIPYETRETYWETIELVRKANPRCPDAGFFYPFEGTELGELSIREGFFTEGVYQRDKPALHFDNLSEDELIGMLQVFPLYTKLPVEYEPYIRKAEAQNELGEALRKILGKVYGETVWANNGRYADNGKMGQYIGALNECLRRQK